MSTESPTLALKDVDLVPFTIDDVDEQYHAWLQDIEVIRYLDAARHDRSMESLRAFVSAAIADPNRHFFKIVLLESTRKVGTSSLTVDPRHRTASFGYLIGEREFWGSEVALQAQIGLFDFGFGELVLRKLYGGACISNTGSNFNYHRLGFRREAIRRAHVLIGTEGDEPCDIVEYACLAEEWAERSASFDQYRRKRDR